MRGPRHQRLTTATAIVLLVSAGLACSLLRPKKSLTWQLVLQVEAAGPDRDAAVAQTAVVIERRLDALGVSDSAVTREGDRIRISSPNVPDRERLKKIITAGGRLELVAVISPPSPMPVQTYNSKEEATASLGGTVPVDRRVLLYAERSEDPGVTQNAPTSQMSNRWVVVESPAIVGGNELRSAAAVQGMARDQYYQITFSLKPAGAERFGAWTGANINKYIGVVLNDEVKSIAYIKGQIFDQGEINGNFSKQSAEDIAHTLNSGALPAPVRIVEEGAIK